MLLTLDGIKNVFESFVLSKKPNTFLRKRKFVQSPTKYTFKKEIMDLKLQ